MTLVAQRNHRGATTRAKSSPGTAGVSAARSTAVTKKTMPSRRKKVETFISNNQRASECDDHKSLWVVAFN